MVIDIIIQAGLTIETEGGNLVVRPKELITDEVRAFIRTHKAEILAELGKQTPPNAPLSPDEASGHPTVHPTVSEALKTQETGIVAWDSPLFGRLEAPVLSRDFDSFTLIHPLTGETVTLPNEWLVSMDERSAILEYDGGLPREEADKQAREEYFRMFRKGGAK